MCDVGKDGPVSGLREVTLLGSTGSIGRQAIEVAQQNPDRLRVTGLAAGGADVGLLADQALSLGVINLIEPDLPSLLNAIDGMSVVAPSAAFYAMPKVELPAGVTDEDYVLALLRATGILCVYGSGFGTAPGDGFFRVVFLAPPTELSTIYDEIAGFTGEFLARR
jgi:hypothetical protein